MNLRHSLKRWSRNLYSRVLVHTGLWRLVNRMGGPRLLILGGHSVDGGSSSALLGPDMKISPARLGHILGALGKHFDLVTVGEGHAVLQIGPARSMVALSMDDGYKDNRTELLAVLEQTGARCTVFLEGRPLEARRVSWLHKWFWLVERLGAAEAGKRCVQFLESDAPALEQLLESGAGDPAGPIKQLFKYRLPAATRDAALSRVFEQSGGDEAALCEALYMDKEDARALLDSGRVELGGHTYSHEVLNALPGEEAAAEIQRGRETLERLLGPACGVSFAYPFGRNWDHGPEHGRAALASGYACALTTHAGVNRPGDDPAELKRWMLEEQTPLHLLITEACGGFELLRRFGLDLVE